MCDDVVKFSRPKGVPLCWTKNVQNLTFLHNKFVKRSRGRSLDITGRSWALSLTFLGARGRSWTLLDAPGRSWTLLDAPGHSWTLLDAPGRSWTLLDAFGRSWFVISIVV